MTKEQLGLIYLEADKCSRLECDGTTRVLSHLLKKMKIPHEVFIGKVLQGKNNIPLHWWIQLSPVTLIDFKARMWLGEKAPNGVFDVTDTTAIYVGEATPMPTSDRLVEILLL